ncbi:DNA polymerase IV [Lagierella sp.]|uniref:DNA polymerase IV n=1 Tax=Lagierella sp. TaxID=2849657 RepID=UPI00260F19FE|nr:DNA polymerase IV [Lagierella sp.]
MKDGLNFLHMDLDAFFASVEELDNPNLKGHPMVVGGRSERGIITTANYEARKYGLHSAMPIFMAKKLCPNIIIVPTRHERYEKKSREVFKIISKYSTLIEKMSIDEACLDISHLEKDPVKLAREIQMEVFKKTGLTLSIGISYNKSLAKLASDWNKPRGIFVIRKEMIPRILENLPVEKISGVGEKTKEKLNSFGVYKVRDLLQLKKPLLKKQFGKLGEVIYDRARGVDNRKVDNSKVRKSLGIERTFPRDISSMKELMGYVKDFSKQLSQDLKDRKIMGKTISIKLKFNNFETITRSMTLDNASDDFREIYLKSSYLIRNVDINRPVRLLGISSSNLTNADFTQISIWDYPKK